VVGLVAFAVVMLRNENETSPAGATGPPLADAMATEPARQTVPLDPQVRRVAGEFVRTTVTRDDLARGWTLIHPELKAECACTREQWLSGEIPIQPYPSDALDDASFVTDESYEGAAVLQVALLPRQGADVESQIFYIGLKKTGKGAGAEWLVNYWAPRAIHELPVVE
jgi:hypothetical protein